MSPPMFRELNPLLHSELRLAVMSLLLGEVEKSFRGRMPRTTCRITQAGLEAFEQYVEAISGYIRK